MGISANIKRMRLDEGLTQEQLAEKLGVTRSTVTQWETGWSQPRMGAISKLASVFGVSVSEMVEDGNNPPKDAIFPAISPRATAPLLGRVHAGSAQEPEVLEDEIELPHNIRTAHPNAYFLQVEGDCMDKVYPEGCYILVDPDREPSNGSIAAVAIDGHDAVMRRLLRTASTIVLAPESTNPEHKDLVITATDEHTVELVGTVVWFQASREME